jgi:hypothetical protein
MMGEQFGLALDEINEMCFQRRGDAPMHGHFGSGGTGPIDERPSLLLGILLGERYLSESTC